MMIITNMSLNSSRFVLFNLRSSVTTGLFLCLQNIKESYETFKICLRTIISYIV
ncbi:hypothetical protein F901_03189 [Acinetobacter dispersus]|nr:hypothetical protein F901_03189 [Acinetobacter dispersus]